ncbi:MAG: PAS domain S-box protein [bacterium]|nr:PAS domain S-box protein [bacterium]
MNISVDQRRGTIRLPVCLAVALALLAPGWLCAAPITQILVLHSYAQEYPWTRGQHEGFMQALAADTQVDATVSTEYLDTKRRAYDATYARELARHLQLKYAGCTPAAIYVTDDNALLFARDHLARIFPGTPVFFSGVNDYSVRTNLNAALFTGVFERKEVAPNIAWLLRMDKDANDLVFIGDASNTDKAIEREARQDLTAYRLRATFIAETNVEQAVAQLHDLPGKYLFLTTVGGMTDAQGRMLPLRTILQRLAHAGRIVISMEDAYIMEGVLGGNVTSGPQQGAQAARLLLAYLHGTPVSALPPLLKSPNVLVFDDRVLQQHGLTMPAQLRAHALILHPHLDFYALHRALILGSLLGLAALLFVVVIVALLILLRKNREVGRARTILQASEQSYRNQFANNSTVMLLIDPADGAIIDANAAALRFYGYAHAQLLAMNITAINTLPAAEVRVAITAAMEGRSQPFEFQHRLADGSLRDVAVSASNIQSGGRTVLHTIIQDVTERQRAARAVQQGAQRAHQQRSAIARLAVDDALASGDVPTVMRRLTEEAAAAIQIERASVWLLSEDQATLCCSALFEATPHTHHAGAVLNSADYPRYFAAIRAESRICAGDARTDPRTREFTAGYLVPLGITAMLDAGIQMDGALAGVVCFEHVGAPRAWHADEEAFATTIAALAAQTLANAKRKQAEAALQENRRQLTDIIDFLPDATLAIDRDKRVIIWNKAIEKMTGIPAAAMLGQGAYAYTIPFYGEARPQLMDLIFEEHAAIAALYAHITRVGDTLVAEAFCNALYHNQGAWVSVKATPLYDQAGTIIGAIESIRDITGRKQAEAQLQRATDRLALATRAGGVGIWDYATASRRLTWDDQMFCLYGITPEAGAAPSG